ncbi:MAG TPA: glutathione S-transferase N-terminal domain-containing protein [Alphaproteobacteria bacterium]|nr:glutathione S-transferase N-terminal domain-containing protein [Alphaproteobacteria bacterium]
MYRLFYAPGSAAMAPHAVLEEIGAKHELVLVDLQKKAHQRPEYLKLNPKGRVPVLVDGDFVLTESAAIIMHLADRHPEAKLAPALGTPQRAHWYQWLLYLSNTLQPAFLEYFYPERSFPDAPNTQQQLKASAERRLAGMFIYIDSELAVRGPYVLGETFSAADIFMHMLARWSRWFEKPAYRYIHIKQLTDLVKARPAVQRMMKAQGIVEQEKA